MAIPRPYWTMFGEVPGEVQRLVRTLTWSYYPAGHLTADGSSPDLRSAVEHELLLPGHDGRATNRGRIVMAPDLVQRKQSAHVSRLLPTYSTLVERATSALRDAYETTTPKARQGIGWQAVAHGLVFGWLMDLGVTAEFARRIDLGVRSDWFVLGLAPRGVPTTNAGVRQQTGTIWQFGYLWMEDVRRRRDVPINLPPGGPDLLARVVDPVDQSASVDRQTLRLATFLDLVEVYAGHYATIVPVFGAADCERLLSVVLDHSKGIVDLVLEETSNLQTSSDSVNLAALVFLRILLTRSLATAIAAGVLASPPPVAPPGWGTWLVPRQAWPPSGFEVHERKAVIGGPPHV